MGHKRKLARRYLPWWKRCFLSCNFFLIFPISFLPESNGPEEQKSPRTAVGPSQLVSPYAAYYCFVHGSNSLSATMHARSLLEAWLILLCFTVLS